MRRTESLPLNGTGELLPLFVVSSSLIPFSSTSGDGNGKSLKQSESAIAQLSLTCVRSHLSEGSDLGRLKRKRRSSVDNVDMPSHPAKRLYVGPRLHAVSDSFIPPPHSTSDSQSPTPHSSSPPAPSVTISARTKNFDNQSSANPSYPPPFEHLSRELRLNLVQQMPFLTIVS